MPIINYGTVRKLTPDERALDVALVNSDLQDLIEAELVPTDTPRKLITPPLVEDES
jgi:hypothetical protein